MASDSQTQPEPEAPPLITVHHLSDSRSQRILWLLEDLSLPYTVKRYERLSNRLAPPELKKVHPLGKSPVITDGNVTLAESGAIVEYLLRKYGDGRAKPTAETEADDIYWLHYSEGSLMPLRVQGLFYQMMPSQFPLPMRSVARFFFGKAKEKTVDPRLEANVAFVTEHLRTHNGHFSMPADPHSGLVTAADYMMSFPLEALSAWDVKYRTPEIIAFLDQVHAKPGYVKALEKGGNYAYAKTKKASM